MLQSVKKGKKKEQEQRTLSIKNKVDKADQIFEENHAENDDDDFEDVEDSD